MSSISTVLALLAVALIARRLLFLSGHMPVYLGTQHPLGQGFFEIAEQTTALKHRARASALE